MSESAKHPEIGPGCYENNKSIYRNRTCVFSNNFSKNLFVTREGPGPSDYNTNVTSETALSIVQAFGSTEKRFMQT